MYFLLVSRYRSMHGFESGYILEYKIEWAQTICFVKCFTNTAENLTMQVGNNGPFRKYKCRNKNPGQVTT